MFSIQKYETVVGERGIQLSGGERQRIVIARALVRRPTLLLLDEASSALDNQSEKLVQKALKNTSKDRTTIVIAHRLSTVLHANKIVVIDNGMVIEEGTHHELMQRQSAYYALVNSEMFEQSSEDDNRQSQMKLTPSIEDYCDSTALDEETIVLQNGTKTTKNKSEKTIRWPSLAILKINRPEIPLIVVGALASIFNGGLEPMSAVLLSETIGIYQGCDRQVQNEKIQMCIRLYLLLAVVIAMTMFIQNYMFARSGEALTKRLRAKAFRSILQQEMAWFDRVENNTGTLCTRLSMDAVTIQGVAGARIGTILSSFANLGVGLLIAFIFCWQLSLVALVFIPFILTGGFLQGYLMNGYFNQDSKTLETAGSLATQALQNIRTVRQLAIESRLLNDYCHLLDIPYKSSFKRVYTFALIYSLTISVSFFSMAAVFSYGGLLVEQKVTTFTNIIMIVNCMLFGAQTFGHSVALAPDYGKAVSAAQRMLALFARQSTIPVMCGGSKLKNFTGALHFKDVEFAYPTRPCLEILHNFNLDIQNGQRIALVGTSGSGKSTVLHLVERFYDVLNGSVLIDSKDLRDIDINWWRSQVGVITQEPVLFSGSIAENLAYGDLSRAVTIDEMIGAAKTANIHEFIQQLPQGYQTCVGSRGDQLSGGQKQRLAIARVLIRNPKVVLLDEPTSALDSENEKVVNEALTCAMIGRTTIIVAHRLSTIRDADLICVLHHGHIIESGTHFQLLAKKGHYYKLLQCAKEA
ncbi:unnamed protein product [Adineta ricciae]|uniref:Uncharacterized protein n=1 Tax=Adineta ricciae TaxID=249248 RepID=A0A814S2E6_ADIRI|nr:unnamed protein product [Adineta ricciae]